MEPDDRSKAVHPGRWQATGLTWMVWGLAVAGIFLSYNVAGAWAQAPGWLFGLLWLPPILAGVAISWVIGRILDPEGGFDVSSLREWGLSAGVVLGIIGVEALVPRLGLALGPNGLNLVLLAALIPLLTTRPMLQGALRWPAVAATALTLATAGVLIDQIAVAELAKGLVAAGTSAVALLLMGALGPPQRPWVRAVGP